MSPVQSRNSASGDVQNCMLKLYVERGGFVASEQSKVHSGSVITLRACCLLFFLTVGLSAEYLEAQVAHKTIEYLSPVPGSSLVSQTTNIIFGLTGRLSESLVLDPSVLLVEGSESGLHAGILALSDDKRRLLYQPLRPFAAGEVVTVRLRPGIRTIEGQSVESIEFRFSVSPLSSLDQSMLMARALALASERGMRPVSVGVPNVRQLRKTSSDSLPNDFPKRSVFLSTGIAPGMLFLATFKIAEATDHLNFISLVPSDQQYLMILDNTGKPAFYRKMPSMSTDFKLQSNGYLTYFDNSRDAYFELDSTYTVVDSFRCGNGYRTNLHDFLLLPDGHHLMLGDDPEMVDMSSMVPGGSAQATALGAVIQELDRNNHVVFQWRSIDHFKVTDATHEDMTSQMIDYVHPNTIELDSDGNIMLSSRHMDEITKINRTTGEIIWRWGGKNNQFKYLGDSVGFSHQHTIRRTQAGTLMVMDNGNYRSPAYSTMAEYSLDEQAKTVRLVKQYRHSPDIFAVAMGSVERLPNGNTLIGWGSSSPAVTEIRPDGTIAFELQLPDSIVSYRVFRTPWRQAETVSTVKKLNGVPLSYTLDQNYPNPFNPATKIRFGLPKETGFSLVVYDVLGRRLATLADGRRPAGLYTVTFDASKLKSGVYYYRLSTPEGDITRSMTLVK
jgi:hypothetical protein